MDKQTSDERLLKLIEGAAEPKHRQVTMPLSKKSLTNFIPAKLNLLELKTVFKNLKIDLRSLNKGLIAIAALSTLIFLYSLFSAPVIPKSNDAFFTPAGSSAIIKLLSSEEAQGLIRKSISSRDIKRDFFLPSGTKSSVNLQGNEQDITEETKNLKLVGIIWSKNPEVMIENAKDSRTYVLKKGDFLDERFKVTEISRTSAILVVTTEEGPKQFEIR